MREHPIPQDITGYRFHIVGSMTLKQFGELALGAIIAFIIYSTNLFPVIKWPLMFVAFGLGALAAFVPIAERPIDHWIITFFKVLYKPTQYYWKRKEKIPDVFLFKPGKITEAPEDEVDLTPLRRQRIREYLSSTQYETPSDDLLVEERAQIQEITKLFGATHVRPKDMSSTQPKITQRPNLTTRVREMRQDASFDQVFTIFSQGDARSAPVEKARGVQDLVQETTNSNKKSMYLTTEQVAQNIEVPETDSIAVEKNQANKSLERATASSAPEEQFFIADQSEADSGPAAAGAATYNTSLPFPDKPSVPNKLVGMVLSAQNELIPDAIVEIRTASGSIERAVKSNALGQFFITTPLANGEYVIEAEKDRLQFPAQSFVLTGKPVDPIEIRSSA
ncbi:MAG: hypothetical protein GW946_00590 [Candidatus Pacebacteria bacterium]|nr:hypothetical protein [Candidatus Paceibacterota bacterium]PIR60890.1 MAG: hypothetical protein COU67_00330 [Candidatus Pacebacteria bacterium CG10_big_fil_rev_8_21_14_0_10_44_54]